MLPTPRIDLDLLLFLISLLQTLLHTDMLEFPRKGSGEGETFICLLLPGTQKMLSFTSWELQGGPESSFTLLCFRATLIDSLYVSSVWLGSLPFPTQFHPSLADASLPGRSQEASPASQEQAELLPFICSGGSL